MALKDTGVSPILPPPAHCTDNATMIAWVAKEYLDMGLGLRPFDGVRQEWPMQDIKLDVVSVPSEPAEQRSPQTLDS